jgi:hypothetical protein
MSKQLQQLRAFGLQSRRNTMHSMMDSSASIMVCMKLLLPCNSSVLISSKHQPPKKVVLRVAVREEFHAFHDNTQFLLQQQAFHHGMHETPPALQRSQTETTTITPIHPTSPKTCLRIVTKRRRAPCTFHGFT